MSHQRSRITPSDLDGHPELAVLEILDCAVAMARVAVIAVHPELTDADPDTVPTDIEVLAAEHFVIAVDSVHRVIESYRAVMKANAAQNQHPLSNGDDDDPF